MTSFDLDLSKYDLGWNDEGVEYAFEPEKGINPGVVEQISWWKGEPRWMTDMRLRSLRLFERKPMAEWFAVNMPDIDFQDITYYSAPKSASDGPKDLSDVDPDTLPVTHGEKVVARIVDQAEAAGAEARRLSEMLAQARSTGLIPGES